MTFIQHLQSNITEHQLLSDSKPVIVAVSGGADSVALLAALSELGVVCVAAHCNYHLRGQESNRDMRAVQRICADLGIDLYVRDFDVAERQQRTGESVEMACRELRYEWFADLLDRLRAQAIAVAHHREDNVETFMLNLLRGSGLAGLSGMRWRNGYVIRPLLDFSRSEIEQYLHERGIEFVVDSTNAESIYARNRLRNVVLPMIDELFPGASGGILASIGHLCDNRDLYDSLIEEKRKAYVSGSKLLLAQLLAQEPHPRTLLFELLRPMGFNITHIDNLLASARKSGITFVAQASVGFGSRQISSTTELLLDRGIVHISQRNDRQQPLQPHESVVSLTRDILSPVHILVSEHPVAQFKPERNPRVAYFDADLLAGSPTFTIRRWQRGDRMTPYGMASDKLVSDLFTNAKYSLDDKRRAWVLARDAEILWVVGLRQSAVGSITPDTRRYLRLELRN